MDAVSGRRRSQEIPDSGASSGWLAPIALAVAAVERRSGPVAQGVPAGAGRTGHPVLAQRRA